MMDFEDIAEKYESWYGTSQGQRADRLERALLAKMLKTLRHVSTVLEVGCGTGHFTRWLEGEGLWTVGLDISSAMLVEARRTASQGSYVRGDGLALPFPDHSFDLVTFITALEFIAKPEEALSEAGRVARRGVLIGGLNRHSLLALQRRWQSLWRPTIYDQAHLFTVGELKRLARKALGEHLAGASWRTTLLPRVWSCTDSSLPWGAFLAMLLELEAEENA